MDHANSPRLPRPHPGSRPVGEVGHQAPGLWCNMAPPSCGTSTRRSFRGSVLGAAMLCLSDSSYQNINLRFVFYFIILTEYSIKWFATLTPTILIFAVLLKALFWLHVLGCVGLLLWGAIVYLKAQPFPYPNRVVNRITIMSESETESAGLLWLPVNEDIKDTSSVTVRHGHWNYKALCCNFNFDLVVAALPQPRKYLQIL